MEDLRFWAPILIALAALVWNIWLVRQGARKDALAKLETNIATAAQKLETDIAVAASKLEARIIETERAVESKAGRAWVEGIQNQVQSVEPRVQKLEVECLHLPTGNEFHLLALKVEGLAGDMKVVSATLKTNTEITRRVEEYLLNEKAS